MRRALSLALMASALLLSAGTAATASKFHQHRFVAALQNGVNNAGLEFNAYYKNGEPRYITDLEWHNLSCNGNPVSYAGVQHWSFGVNSTGKFNKTHLIHNGYPGSTATIAGKFIHENRDVTGTLSLSATPSCPAGTGAMTFRTHRN